jgi:predicted alpha/beta hydrolase
MTNLSTYRTLPRWALVVRFALVGFFAGFFAWVLVGAPQKISVTAFGRKRPVIMAKSERLVSARKPPVE